MDANLGVRALTGILHLSTKYSTPHIRQRCISALQTYFPATLTGYLKAGKVPCSDLFHLANIASETHANILLVSALFLCACTNMSDLLDGSRSCEGEVVLLNQSNLQNILRNRHRLTNLARSKSLKCIYYDEWKCEIGTCKAAQLASARSLLRGRPSDGFHNPLTVYRMKPPSLFGDFCSKCQGEVLTSMTVGMNAVWLELPAVFGFDNWNILAAENEAEGKEMM